MENGIYNVKAIQSYLGFVKGRKYVIDIRKPPHSPYEVFNVEDPNMYFTTASEISLKQKFDFEKTAH